MAEVKPEYYKNNNGNDLFDEFEAGLMTEGETRGFYKGNIYKYLTRYEAKAGIEDLNKANTYMSRLIRFEHLLEQKEKANAHEQLLGMPGSVADHDSSANVQNSTEVNNNGFTR